MLPVSGSGTNGRLPSQQHPDEGATSVGGVRGEDKIKGVVVEMAAVADAEEEEEAIRRRLLSLLALPVLLLLLQLPLLIAPYIAKWTKDQRKMCALKFKSIMRIIRDCFWRVIIKRKGERAGIIGNDINYCSLHIIGQKR